jgi:hypothetical protein
MIARVARPRPPAQLRRTAAGLLAAIVVLAAGACAPAGPDPSPSPTAPGPPAPGPTTQVATATPSAAAPSAPALADTQSAVDRLFAAGSAGDRTGWDAGVAALDPSFALRSSLLFDNLRGLRLARLQVHLTGAEQKVPAARSAELGPDARVLQGQLRWRLRGEHADASSSVWLTLVPGPHGPRLAGTDDGTGLDTPAAPLWWLTPVTRLTRGKVTVLVAAGQPAGRWADLASRAAADAREHLPRSLTRAWDGHLVVEVPGSEADFARVLGAAPSAYATTAAVTRPEGPTTRAAVRVVVNPATAKDPDAELGTTLVHETVHVATRSATSDAPLWAVEGLAEHVALKAHPEERADELATLRGAKRPTRLPRDAAFTSGAKDVTTAYAQAWLVCLAVADHRGRGHLGRFYTALGRGDTVEQAARSTLGVDDSVVVGWWRDALRRAASERG